ncbi:polyphosphate polymerase domain-containing protein [Cellulomonas sp. Leaf334]|uniref:polyphosphate polymerase domain-containing protein n=1 Tax=Cellulomonas sp. Leaf334 TaxID=1736339 RepID=UPI000AE289B3|nr:polyphosphate polymerase domain-containing protein [Cellulomonas sp. Leaf334]
MTETVLDTPLRRLAPMSLDELIERAGLQTRVDRKYLVPVAEVDALLDRLASQAQVLDIGGRRLFDYESVYFDTADLMAYHLAAHRRRRRFKVRTRSYLDSAQCWLEVKTRGPRGTTVKERLPYDLRDRDAIAHGRWFVAGVLGAHGIRGTDDLTFAPTLVTRYLRTTLFLPQTASRVTVDVGLSWHDGRAPLHLRDVAVVETKTGSTASGADRLLWAHGYRPQRISKYATGLAALRPDLPATRWRRTLHRHLLPSSTTTPA